jgi:diguanylate cyclase (GGDEF)-like protein/PAS domain S-box-containing protein
MWIYDMDSLAFLAVNEAAIDAYGYSRSEFLAMTIADIRPAEDIEALRENIAAVDDSIDRAGTWRHLKKDGSLIYVEITSYPLEFEGHKAELVLAYDVGRQVRDEADLNRLLAFEHLVAGISRLLSAQDDLDAAIEQALARLGQFNRADRAYLFRFSPDKQTMSNTHEWCAEGVESQRAGLQDLSTARFAWSMARLIAGESTSIPDVSSMPDEIAEEREAFRQLGLSSLLIVPLRVKGESVGFLGFDNLVTKSAWGELAVRLLEITGELVAAAMQRRQVREALRAERDFAEAVMDTVAALIVVLDREGRIVQFNRACESLTGYDFSEVEGHFVWDFLLPAAEREQVSQVFRRLKDLPRQNCFENHWVTKDGRELLIEWSNTAILGPKGELLYGISTGIDVTGRRQAQQALETSEARYRLLVENLSYLVVKVDTEGRFEFVSPSYCVLFGKTEAELIGNSFMPLVHEDDRETTAEVMRDLYRPPYRCTFEQRAMTVQGWRWLSWADSAVLDESGAVVAVVGVGRDITERHQAEEQLRVAAAVFDSTAEGVTVTDVEGTIIDVNSAFTRITGYPRADVIGKNPRVFNSGRHDQDFYQAMYASLRDLGVWRGEIWNRRKSGEIYPSLLTVNTVKSPEGRVTGYVGVFADITELKESEQRLAHLAHHDPLTDLPNRLLLGARLRQAMRHAIREKTRIAVIFLDIDRFKTINDGLGHPVGDLVLQQLAGRLTRVLRGGDTVARISGDEFVILLENLASADEAGAVVQKLMDAAASPIHVDGKEIRITLSIGITFFPDDTNDADELLRNADSAMYRAKQEGRNTYRYYTSELTVSAFEHALLESSLRNALAGEELRLLYQPQYNLENDRIIGLEALLRWQHPELGAVSPGRFIPIAEQSGLIGEIGAWVLRTACAQGREWLDAGYEFGRIAVNVAGPQFNSEGFVDLVLGVLQASGLPPDHLALEITEGFVMYGRDPGVAQLETLRAQGVEVAIDDFGTGYSSLRYLKDLPIDKLKIDQSFIRGIPMDRDDTAIAAAIISMGRALELKVIAEGVETTEQMAFLRQQGCLEIQGFVLARPLPAGDVGNLIRPAE